jgi:dUTP pyrophosphatase
MLSGEEIQRLGIVAPGLDLPDLHVQPNGIDLTLDAVWRIGAGGSLGIADEDRHLPERSALEPDEHGWLTLHRGTYGIRFAEPVAIPLDRGGLAFPRSSLLRMGAHIPTAVWDAGYQGRAESLLVVLSDRLGIQRHARLAQVVFFNLTSTTTGYQGRYQRENLPPPGPTTD